VHQEIHDPTTHDQLQMDLIEHQWALAEMEEDTDSFISSCFHMFPFELCC
jgi:hypothetical protein